MLLELADDLILEFLERFELLASFHQDDMVAVWSQDRTAHLSRLERIGSLLKLRIHLIRTYPRQLATFGSTSTVLRHLITEFGEVSALFDGLPDGVSPLCDSLLFLWRGLRG